jgi:hypothetical protein
MIFIPENLNWKKNCRLLAAAAVVVVLNYTHDRSLIMLHFQYFKSYFKMGEDASF